MPLTILYAEDEPLTRESYVSNFQEAGFRVIVASDGKSAFELFQLHKKEIDVVLTDQEMPNLNGAGLATALRAEKYEAPIWGYSSNPLSLPEGLFDRTFPKWISTLKEDIIPALHELQAQQPAHATPPIAAQILAEGKKQPGERTITEGGIAGNL